jgi:hypothetical protein
MEKLFTLENAQKYIDLEEAVKRLEKRISKLGIGETIKSGTRVYHSDYSSYPDMAIQLNAEEARVVREALLNYLTNQLNGLKERQNSLAVTSIAEVA